MDYEITDTMPTSGHFVALVDQWAVNYRWIDGVLCCYVKDWEPGSPPAGAKFMVWIKGV